MLESEVTKGLLAAVLVRPGTPAAEKLLIATVFGGDTDVAAGRRLLFSVVVREVETEATMVLGVVVVGGANAGAGVLLVDVDDGGECAEGEIS
jgi:hypothetical protein